MKFAITMTKPEVYGIRHVHHYNLVNVKGNYFYIFNKIISITFPISTLMQAKSETLWILSY